MDDYVTQKKFRMTLFLLTFLTMFCTSVNGQDKGRIKVWFFEWKGAGLNYSINFDTRFNVGTQDGLGCRIGFGYDEIKGYTNDLDTGIDDGFLAAKEYIVPLEINYILGKYRNGIDLGLGTLFYFIDFSDRSGNISLELTPLVEFTPENNKEWLGFLSLGYRFQALSNGLVFRATWNPLFNKNGFIANHTGLSIGYKF